MDKDDKQKLGMIGKRIAGKISMRFDPDHYPDINKAAKSFKNKVFRHLDAERIVQLIENAADESYDINESQARKDREHIRTCKRCQDKLKTSTEVLNFILRREKENDDEETNK